MGLTREDLTQENIFATSFTAFTAIFGTVLALVLLEPIMSITGKPYNPEITRMCRNLSFICFTAGSFILITPEKIGFPAEKISKISGGLISSGVSFLLLYIIYSALQANSGLILNLLTIQGTTLPTLFIFIVSTVLGAALFIFILLNIVIVFPKTLIRLTILFSGNDNLRENKLIWEGSVLPHQ